MMYLMNLMNPHKKVGGTSTEVFCGSSLIWMNPGTSGSSVVNRGVFRDVSLYFFIKIALWMYVMYHDELRVSFKRFLAIGRFENFLNVDFQKWNLHQSSLRSLMIVGQDRFSGMVIERRSR